MQPNTTPKDDDNRQPVAPDLAQLMDMLDAPQDVDLAWLFERQPRMSEDR